ncbi:hypothetical protein SBA4_380022 [Candidatus Sulfopaludibacter sp. SbA4]|nr:hypothetical protein SBA4_380022 [Candidatus Sulfopaludibacter sp. SbA4]
MNVPINNFLDGRQACLAARDAAEANNSGWQAMGSVTMQ